MRPLRNIIQKEIWHILRDRRTLLILFGMPIAQILLFGFAITNEIKGADIAVLDRAQDIHSQAVTERLVASGYFTVQATVHSEPEIEQLFRTGQIKMGVIYPSDLGAHVESQQPVEVQFIADATDPNTATTLVNYGRAIVGDYQRELAPLAQPPRQIQTELRMLYNQELESVFLFVPGVMTIILMLVSAMMTSIALTREKELGTMEVLLVSPLRPPLIILGKVIPYVLLSMINTLLILGLSVWVFDMPIRGSFVLLFAESLLFVITALSLGILISTRTSSQQVAMMMSLMVLMLPTILLSGFIFPIESMPQPLQIISHIIPAKWFILIIKDIMLKGVGWAFIWQETLILTGMTTLFIGLSIRNFNIRLS